MIPKQIPEVEWDTQEEIQPLPHRLAHICCQIPPLSPGLSNDQQCYQWFTGKLNSFMDTYLSSSAGQGPEDTHSVGKWSLSDRFMSNPDCIFCHSDGCKKVKKTYYFTIEPLSKFEFGGWETVLKLQRLKTRSWFPSMDQGIGHLWLWSQVPPKLSERYTTYPKIILVQPGC